MFLIITLFNSNRGGAGGYGNGKPGGVRMSGGGAGQL